jgi:hypothetical protein
MIQKKSFKKLMETEELGRLVPIFDVFHIL